MNISKLLINEPPLLVMPSLAAKIGLNEAILLQQIHYWLSRSEHRHGGRTWFYRTATEWVEELIFWSDSTIKRTLANLEAAGLISSAKLHRELLNDPYTRTKWYAINYDQLEGLTCANASGQNDQMATGQNDQISTGQNDQMLQENTTENTTEITDGASAGADHPEQAKTDRMDYDKLLEVYHATLPEMAEVRILTDTRKRAMRTFWKKFKFDENRWLAYLQFIAENCRWMLEDRPNGRGGFWKRKNLDYLITERCYVAVKEGRADDR